MKIKPIAETKIERKGSDPGQVTIHHSQSYRLVINYQSAESSFGISLSVNDTPSAISAGIKKAKEIIEPPLKKKVMEQQKFLQDING